MQFTALLQHLTVALLRETEYIVICPASTISLGRRQLFLPINDNYLLMLRRRAAPAAGAEGEARSRFGFSFQN